MLPQVGVLKVFKFKPHKKLKLVYKLPKNLSPYLSGQSRTKCKWRKIPKKTEPIYSSYCRQATDTRLFVSRPHLFNHLSHQIPKMRNSQ